MKLRAIIVDDEFLARKRLAKLLENFEEIIIVAECRNGQDALTQIELKEPDLIFLDIQMPDIDGFSVLSKLKHKPSVIFTTAYDLFALKAFEINAIDYLLKPFDEERLEIAITRIIELKRLKKSILLEDEIKKLLNDYSFEKTAFINEIIIKNKGKEINILVDNILYFKSDGNYIKLVTLNKQYLHRMSMNNLENQLDSEQFLRIHRSIIINKFYNKKYKYIGNNEYEFILKNGDKLRSSRSYKPTITAYLKTL